MSKNWPLPGHIFDGSMAPEASLETMRDEIDEIDSALSLLLARRFELSEQIGSVKSVLGRNVKDEAREQRVLERVTRTLSGKGSQEFVLRIFRTILDESVKLQEASLCSRENRCRGERLFQNVCVIGAGLIGGALSRRIKDCFPNTKLSAIDLPDTLSQLQASGLFNDCAGKIEKSLVERASLIVIACLPEVSAEVLQELAPLLKTGQIVVDLCSVKGGICAEAEALNLHGAEFVGAHPFFGTEKNGFENCHELELHSKTVCLVRTSKSSELAMARLRLWLTSMDFRVFVTDAESHDSTVALTSHVIQLLASAVGAVIDDELLQAGKADHLVLSGGALSGLSRLMSSRPEMWEQITAQNCNHIEASLKKVNDKLEQLLTACKENSSKERFERVFSKAAATKRALSDA